METVVFSLLALIVAMGGYLAIAYNGLIRMSQRIKQAFADIDVQMKQRHDLIPNLVEVVKGYATHERGTLEDVIKARNSALTPGQSTADQVKSENFLTATLGRLFALSEAYPDLKANVNFQQLQDELGDIENKIAAARRFYNSAVSEFNASIDAFPINLFSRSFGFNEMPFFDLGYERDTISQVPQVNFSKNQFKD